MKRDVDELISDTDREIEKLKILKTKQEELKQLQTELGVTGNIPVKTESRVEKKHKQQKEHKLPKITITPHTRKVVASIIVLCMISMSVFIFVNRVEAANPTVVYADPDDDSMFADTNDGDGVSWVVNVSDADNDIAIVHLTSNSSGSWINFYESGALGGVAYHNTSAYNGNWTGSWTKYWYNISVKDATWHNTTYSFTTGYQWGDPQMAVLDDALIYDNAVVLKNATEDYYLFYEDGDIDVKTSTSGANWSLESKSDVYGGGGEFLSAAFTYNGMPYCLFYDYPNLYYGYWDGSSWTTGSTGIQQTYDAKRGHYADCIYYNGKWNLLTGQAVTPYNPKLIHYTGTFPSTWVEDTNLETGPQFSSTTYWFPSLAVLDGILHLVYKDTGSDLHWKTYDGVSWTDRGDIGGDSLDLGGGTTSGYSSYGCSIVKDPVNQNLVCVYIDDSGDLRYRVTDNLTSWSESQLLFSEGAYDIRYPHIEYIDHRLTVTFSYNLRTNYYYDIYTMSAPDYSGRISGFNYTYNRIQWPDASPGDTNANSTVFSLKNINDRDIKTITWHFEDLGEIPANSNLKVWTNMSGSWTSIGTCDASGDIATLDISGLMAGGGEWIPGQSTWWKAEILAVGMVNEDLHSTDEDIYYKITF